MRTDRRIEGLGRHEGLDQKQIDRLGKGETADEADRKGDDADQQPPTQLDQVVHQGRPRRLDLGFVTIGQGQRSTAFLRATFGLAALAAAVLTVLVAAGPAALGLSEAAFGALVLATVAGFAAAFLAAGVRLAAGATACSALVDAPTSGHSSACWRHHRRFGRGRRQGRRCRRPGQPGVDVLERRIGLRPQRIHRPLPRPQRLDLLAQIVQFGLSRHFVEAGAELIGHRARLGHHLADATHQDRQILWPHDKQGHDADHH